MKARVTTPFRWPAQNIDPSSTVFADGGSGSSPPPDVYTDTLLFDLGGNPSDPATPAIPDGSIKVHGSSFGTLNYLSYEAVPGFNLPTATAKNATIKEGQTLNLAGDLGTFPANSMFKNSTYLFTSWDLNDDGVFGDAVGYTPQLTWSQLEALGTFTAGKYPGNGTYPIAMEVVYNNFTVTTYATLTIQYAAPTIILTNPGSGIVGQPFTVGFTAQQVEQETVTGWKVTWPDGSVDNLPSDATSDTHVFTQKISGQVQVQVFDSYGQSPDAQHAQGNVTIGQSNQSLNPGGPYVISTGDSLILNTTALGLLGEAMWEISGNNGFKAPWPRPRRLTGSTSPAR